MIKIQGTIVDEFDNPIQNVHVIVGNEKGSVTDKQGKFMQLVQSAFIPISFSHVSYGRKDFASPTLVPDKIVMEAQTLDPVIVNATKPKKMIGKVLLGVFGFWALLKLAKASDEKTQKDKGNRKAEELAKGLKGHDGKNICTNRIKCKGIDKRTGKTKDGYYFSNKGKVVRKHKGLDKNGRLKSGFKYAKGGRIIKIKKTKKGLKQPFKAIL